MRHAQEVTSLLPHPVDTRSLNKRSSDRKGKYRMQDFYTLQFFSFSVDYNWDTLGDSFLLKYILNYRRTIRP